LRRSREDHQQPITIGRESTARRATPTRSRARSLLRHHRPKIAAHATCSRQGGMWGREGSGRRRRAFEVKMPRLGERRWRSVCGVVRSCEQAFRAKPAGGWVMAGKWEDLTPVDFWASSYGQKPLTVDRRKTSVVRFHSSPIRHGRKEDHQHDRTPTTEIGAESVRVKGFPQAFPLMVSVASAPTVGRPLRGRDFQSAKILIQSSWTDRFQASEFHILLQPSHAQKMRLNDTAAGGSAHHSE